MVTMTYPDSSPNVLRQLARWKTSLFISTVFWLLIFSIVPAADAGVTGSEKKQIIVGGEINYPPYSYIDRKGEQTGFSVELTKAIARVMGIDVQIRLTSWPEARKALDEGRVDIILGMFYSEDRAKIYDFSPPFSINSDSIFARRNSPAVKSIEDLRNREIIVMRGEVMHDYIIKHHLSDRLLLTDTPDEALRLLASGKGDYALVAQMPGFYWIKELKLTNINTVGPPLEPFKNCFVVKKGNTVLLSRFVEGLNILNQTGEHRIFYEKWLGVLEPVGTNYKNFVKYAAAVIVPLLILLAGSLLWTRTLRIMVAQRTKELQKSEESLSRAVNAGNVGIWDWDLRTGQIFFSPQWKKQIGFEDHEIAGRYEEWESRLHPNDLAATVAVLKASLAPPWHPYNVEFRMRHKDGSFRWILSMGALEFDEQNQPVRMMGSHIDITERKKTEEALWESNEMFSLFMQHSPIYIYIKEVTPTQSIVLQASDNFQVMIGMTGREIVGKNMAELFSPEFAAKITADDWAVVSNGEVLKLDEELNGRSYSTIKFPLVREDKNLLAGYTIDITDRKLAEEERKKLQDQLQQAQRMESVGRLAGGVAHDFNNMLSIILGYADMSLDALQPSDPLRENIQEIISAGQRSVNVVRQLLAFARKQTVAPKILDLKDSVEDILKMLRRLIGEDIDLLWKPASDLWLVKMDLSQIDQLLANLVINARDAIKDVGKITIETANVAFDMSYCESHRDFLPGEYVQLTVSDDGCGMDKEILANIFEPFFTTKELGKGTGLGLATVYGIVKQNNGFIKVDSEPGKGSTFRIYLPRHQAAEENTEMTALPVEDLTIVETVLLVEDEKVILKLGKIMLERLGYTVLTANTPDEAIRLSREHTGEIHLLITDVIMPEMNGRDLARQLTILYPKLKILFMSGYTANVIEQHGVLDKDIHFIQKPFSRKDLAFKVREALSS
ncbi:MAG: histidine kinase [Desulfobacterium sp.]|nr:histidine kinase [Desulfobacterium sp.]